MKFTYDAYRTLVNRLRISGYNSVGYHDYEKADKCVILRHDVDTSIDKALKLAQLEAKEGIRSTYFFLLTTNFYNIASKESIEKVSTIYKLGHEIGLHFDETKYNGRDCMEKDMAQLITGEAQIMSLILKMPITTVSMHRPSKQTLDADIKIDGMKNSYGFEFFKKFKYISDSRRRWQEDVISTIDSGRYHQLHILTHAFWYNDKEETIEETVSKFVNGANKERYTALQKNITDLECIMSPAEVR